ncbi:PI-PLC X domain-containing protein 1 isoform X4 [Amblyraja radiata]|uniref:PI-PLC X domain-containing protein 1 isoform X4 n=1 Tax=Amblyraja radiata TaxID=386614 RepID=UPI001402D098|nr:PI-PLC X domain-containing protein 1 isoform X4 [Amblyraja radiata]
MVNKWISCSQKMADSRRKEQIAFPSLLQNRFAHWMSDLPEKLWDMSLCNLAIPGSHDSMSYCLDLSSPVKPSEKILKYLDHVMPCITRPEIHKWCKTQESGVTQQLEEGVRFFDLRIAHKPNDATEHLYFIHGVYTTVTVQEQVTLRKLWKLGRQVIISYDYFIAKDYPELWPGIPYWWADTYNAKSLVHYLETQKQVGRPDGFFVAGMNLTEDWWYIATHLISSLKKLTFPNYPYLCDWIKKQCVGPGKPCFNIIAGDFIGAGYLVPVVLDLNRKLI